MLRTESTHRQITFEGLLGIPFTEGNRVDVLLNGCRIFPAMLDAISQSARSIEFLTFIYWQGDIAVRFAEALASRAKAGTTVRVLLDAFGAATMRRELIDQMEGAGVQVRWFRPLAKWKVWASDNRTHRKILVVDGKIGFTGGVGIAEEWEGDARNEHEWRDTHFRITGPAVHGLQAAFYGNWIESGGGTRGALDNITELSCTGDARIQVIRANAAVGWSDIATLLRTIVALAETRLRIVTPYLAPDDATTKLLVDAARRGVSIEIMIPGPYTDKRISEFAGSREIEELLKSGITIWRYQPSMIHAKVITVDGVIACVGSANFNHRSQLKDDEIALVLDCQKTVAILDSHFEDDVRCCLKIDLQSWHSRSPLRRAKELLSRPFMQQV